MAYKVVYLLDGRGYKAEEGKQYDCDFDSFGEALECVKNNELEVSGATITELVKDRCWKQEFPKSRLAASGILSIIKI
jgi:hypothetical protein